MNQSPIFRPLQVLIFCSLGLVLSVILLSSWLTWREQAVLDRARQELRGIVAFQHAQHQIELQLIAIALGTHPVSTEDLDRSIGDLLQLCPPEHRDVRPRIEAFQAHIQRAGTSDPNRLLQSIVLLRGISDMANDREVQLFARLKQETDQQMQYELAAPVAVLAVGALLLPVARRRVMRPLESFGRQMNTLASGDFTPTQESELDEHTLPLHRSFLKLALRLQELETRHRQREDSLKEEVRAATRALLEQQHSLASAERLAATGELAASVAHELRNPLAGIQMSLENLCREVEDPDVVERLRAASAEVERIARLVNDLVAESRHAPEPPSTFDLAALVDELLGLTRYQLPPDLRLQSRIETGLQVRLPRERLRQALLNLILNSSKAIGEAEGSVELEARRSNGDVIITVEDDGPGFPQTLRENGIRPFYSTRERGTGLGLAMVRRFVRDAEGRIELDNREETGDRPGARVTLLLPSAVDHG